MGRDARARCRALKYVPARVQKATAPAQLGLRVLRGATWAATLTLSAVYFRRGCHALADTAVTNLDRSAPCLLWGVIFPRSTDGLYIDRHPRQKKLATGTRMLVPPAEARKPCLLEKERETLRAGRRRGASKPWLFNAGL